MKIKLKLNYLGFYVPDDDKGTVFLSLCGDGIQKVFNVNSPKISLTIKNKNPKKKGFKKVYINFDNRLIIRDMSFGTNYYTDNFISKLGLRNKTIWVKVETI